MRYLPLLLLLCAACSDPEAPAPVSTLLAPASPPPRYARYEELSDLFQQRNDTTYLINFWATWCKPCLEELPLLQELADESRDQALQIVLVSLDTEPGAIERIPAYLAQRAIGLPTVVLTDGRQQWMRELDEKWDGSLPTTFVYRNQLRYIYRRPFRTLLDVRAAVEPLVSQ